MPRVEIGSYEGKVRRYNAEKQQEINKRHSKLNFRQDEENGAKYAQCQQCLSWVRCHHPPQKLTSDKKCDIRMIIDTVPLYEFGGSELLRCGKCFEMYYRKKNE